MSKLSALVSAFFACRDGAAPARRRQHTSALIGFVVLLSLLAVPGGGAATGVASAAAAAPTGPGGARIDLSAADEQSAAALAESSGEPVEISARTSSTARTLAMPDGTYQLEAFSGPVRVRRQGSWVPVDMTLAPDGGVLRPRASAVDMTFSAGGSGLLAVLVRGEYSYGLGWPEALPAPAVSGDTATYTNVSLGAGMKADLTVTALKTGFTHSVILRERPAAPVELRLPIVASGSVGVTGTGGLAMFDESGQQVAQAPTPLMWDSSFDAGPGEPTNSATVDTAVEWGAEGPELVLRPDQAFLSDPALVYPVVVDPTTTLFASDTWVQNTYLNTAQSGSPELKAGHWSPYTARSYLKFNVGSIVGKDVLDADLTMYSYYTSSCTRGSGLQVRRVTSNYSISTVVWGSQPSTTTTGAVTNTNRYGYSSSCPANYMGWDIDAIVRAWAGGTANYGLRVAAVDETDNHTWTRFWSANKYSDNNVREPRLTISYNTPPATPAASSLSSVPGGVCSTDAAVPRISSTAQPELVGVLKDADGRVGAVFEWYLGTTKKGGATIAPVTNSAVTSGYPFKTTIPSGHFADGQVIKWRVQAKDDYTVSGWSPWCYLEIDTTSPNPPGVSSPRYKADGATYDGVGRWGYFDFTAGSADVVGYEYTFPGEAPVFKNAAVEGGPLRIVWTPRLDGPITLQVRSRDDAGRWSGFTPYTFLVAKGSAPVASWKLDDGQGTTAVGDPGGCIATCPDATLGADTGWTTSGRVDGALNLDGVDDHAAASGPVVNSADSFTMAAWVRLESLDDYNTVLCITGTQTCAASLYYSTGFDHWAFNVTAQDASVSANGAFVYGPASSPVTVNTWTHVAGVFDNGADQVHIYINGTLAMTRSFGAAWQATGPLSIGRGRSGAAFASFLDGQADEVRVYDRILTPAEVGQLVASTAVLRSHWSFDELLNGTSPNRVAGGPPAYLENGASLNLGDPEFEDFFGASDLVLDAAGEYAAAEATALPTNDSYSVMAWAEPYELNGIDPATVISKPGSGGGDQFWLGARPAGDGVVRWALAMDGSDSGGGELVVWSDEPVIANEMVHLALTYNALDRKVTLYVNGSCSRWDPATGQTMQPCVAAPVPATFTAAGAIHIGRIRVSLLEGRAHFVGEIDEVRLYTGVVSGTEIAQRQTSA